MENYIELTPSILKLPYDKWMKAVGGELGKNISPRDKGWFKAWSNWDFILSPMDDNIRMYMRYAHFLGYLDMGIYEESTGGFHSISPRGTGVR